jgi:hypothetical protein
MAGPEKVVVIEAHADTGRGQERRTAKTVHTKPTIELHVKQWVSHQLLD